VFVEDNTVEYDDCAPSIHEKEDHEFVIHCREGVRSIRKAKRLEEQPPEVSNDRRLALLNPKQAKNERSEFFTSVTGQS
jgi:rhodanese-related sulfurtransferase